MLVNTAHPQYDLVGESRLAAGTMVNIERDAYWQILIQPVDPGRLRDICKTWPMMIHL